MSRSKRVTVSVIILLITIAIDQLTKSLAISSFKGKAPIIFWGDLFRLQYAENPGAFLSLGADLPDAARFWILTGVVGVFLVGSLTYLFVSKNLPKTSVWGLSLIVGGGVSNLIDRMSRTEGRVVDFMNMGIGELRTGIFNVADMAIMAGLGLMLWESFRAPKAAAQAPEAR